LSVNDQVRAKIIDPRASLHTQHLRSKGIASRPPRPVLLKGTASAVPPEPPSKWALAPEGDAQEKPLPSQPSSFLRTPITPTKCRGKRIVARELHQSLFNRILVNIFPAHQKILAIPHAMICKPTLPHRKLRPHPMRKSTLDELNHPLQSHTLRRKQKMHMVRHHYKVMQ
jgi:hypothetical protein